MARRKAKSHVFLIVFLIIAAGVAAFWYFWQSDDYSSLTPQRTATEDLLTAKNRINFLIIGVDAEDLTNDSGRSDAIMILSMDMLNKKANLLSIPRDTYVEIPGDGMNKINHAFYSGGIDLAKQTIVGLLHIPLDYYVITNFSGFQGIIDTLGGVEIDVEKRMYHHTYDGLIDIDAGLQTLDGETALQYVRFRSDALGDISRSERQRKFMVALFEKMKSPETILKLPQLVPQLSAMTNTDLSSGQLLQLVKLMNEVDLTSITMSVLPGDFMDQGGISYWQVNEEDMNALISEYYSEPVKETDTDTANFDTDVEGLSDTVTD